MIGTIVGHKYRITELLGTGGMAHVYKAYNLSTHRIVAVKVLKEEFRDNAEFLRRFEREAKAVLHLTHENIVRAYGVGEVDGLPYIILEYVEGQTLKELIVNNGPMPPRIAIGIVTQVLDALAAAHSAGIIHRDVKPQNVIVTNSGKAKLTDFGIARDLDASTKTFNGSTVLGSVHYLSPEQAMGKPVSEASDIYSVGVMLYEMLVGDVPFNSDNSVSVALMHINDDPIPPIQLNVKIPPSLNDVVMRALSKSSSDRYQSAAAMQRHLNRSLKDPNGDFARKSTGETTSVIKKSAQKKRKLHGALKIGIILASVIVVLATVFFILTASYKRQSAEAEIVPTLTGRSIDDARTKAENYGFEFIIQDYEVSETVPFGYIIAQSPAAGMRAMNGTKIQVIVSIGPDLIRMPSLTGLTLDEAKSTLELNGLILGQVSYVISDVAIGYVCSQSVLADTEVQRQQTVDISISASSEESVGMPELVQLPFSDAVKLLKDDAFANIFIRYQSAGNSEVGIVLEQSPAVGAPVLPDTQIYLTVNGVYSGDYYADAAFNLSISEPGTHVMAVLIDSESGVNFYHILYEATLEKGEQVPFSFTAYSDSDGMREIIIYINGELYRRQDLNFAPRNNG